MSAFILLLGNVPDSDANLCKELAARSSIDVQIKQNASEVVIANETGFPCGCISFLEPNRQKIIDVFGEMPLGFGQEIPFFQKIETDNSPSDLSDLPIDGFFRTPLSLLALSNIFSAMTRHGALLNQNREIMGEIMKYRKQKRQLISIATSISLHSDLDNLLASILAETRDIVGADAGSIYIREKNSPGGSFTNKIRFKISQNDSVDIGHKSEEFVVSIDQTTVAGFVAGSGRLLNIEDVSKETGNVPYRTGRKEYEKKFEYLVKSMLTVPLKNMAGEVAGIVQLMNKKSDPALRLIGPADAKQNVVPFTVSDEDFILSIASQAAVSIERVQLHQEIKSIFEGYLHSSIAAIDERDSVTYGHSRRVMGYALAFADAVNHNGRDIFKGECFDENRKNQFRFAALLHDIGKIGVPEALLSKESRLSKEAMDTVCLRIEYASARMKWAAQADEMAPWASQEALESDTAFLKKVNAAGFLNEPDLARLLTIAQKQYVDVHGIKRPILTERELECLSVRKGNLTNAERERINSHAQATRRILSRIPWTKELSAIPDIACHHHEKLDGSGYPDGLTEKNISFESKALAVIDIYEALVAQDRPYKPKMAPEKAIEILRAEAKENHLDATIVEFFVSSGIYKIFLEEQFSDATLPQ